MSALMEVVKSSVEATVEPILLEYMKSFEKASLEESRKLGQAMGKQLTGKLLAHFLKQLSLATDDQEIALQEAAAAAAATTQEATQPTARGGGIRKTKHRKRHPRRNSSRRPPSRRRRLRHHRGGAMPNLSAITSKANNAMASTTAALGSLSLPWKGSASDAGAGAAGAVPGVGALQMFFDKTANKMIECILVDELKKSNFETMLTKAINTMDEDLCATFKQTLVDQQTKMENPGAPPST
jgi:hypothetical protein